MSRAIVCALLVMAFCGPAAAVESPRERAATLYAEGTALFHARRYDEAAERFEEAYRAYPTTNLLYNAALAWRKARAPHHEANALFRYLEREDADLRSQATRRLGRLERRLRRTHARVRLRVEPAGAQVLIGGEPAPSRWEGWIEPGDLVVSATAPEYEPGSERWTVEGGWSGELSLTLHATPPAPDPAPAPVVTAVDPPPPPPATPRRAAPAAAPELASPPIREEVSPALQVAGWTSLSVGSTSVFVGLVLNLGLGLPHAKTAEELDPWSEGYLAAHQSIIDESNDRYNYPAYALYAVGGALAVTGIVLLVLDDEPAGADDHGPTVSVTPLPRGGALVLTEHRF